MTIVLRRDIGTALTYDQLDDNFVDYKIFRDKFAQTQWTGDNNGKLLYFNNATGKIELKSLSATDLAGGFSTNFASSFATRTTDDLSEGSTNLYYTSARANADFDIRLATRSTTNLAEGSRLYYTNDRVDARIVNAGSNNWNTAYGWGNHATAGYLTDITAQTIGSLSNVDTTGAVNGKILKYNGTNWVVADDASGAASITLSDLSVGPNALASGSGGISYDNTTGVFTYTPPDLSGATFDGQWSSLTGTPTTIAGYGITDAFNGDYNALSNTPDLSNYLTNLNSESINTLSNVDASDAVGGQVLKYNASTGNWEAENDAGMTAVALTDISDVTITLPTTGQVLKYNGASWVNDADSGYTDSDVDTHLNTSSATSSQVLSWNGSDYAWVAQSGGSGTPAGADTQVQFNSSGSFGADADFTYNSTTNTLTVENLVASSIAPPSTLTGTYTISSPTTITLDPTDEIINDAPMKLVSKTVTELSTLVSSTGAMVFCTDESGGSIPAFYDGTNWRRVSDRAIVS